MAQMGTLCQCVVRKSRARSLLVEGIPSRRVDSGHIGLGARWPDSIVYLLCDFRKLLTSLCLSAPIWKLEMIVTVCSCQARILNEPIYGKVLRATLATQQV